MNSITIRVDEFKQDMKGMNPEQARLYAERRIDVVKRFTAVVSGRMREAGKAGKHFTKRNLARGGLEGGI